jgi:hypothetical protein
MNALPPPPIGRHQSSFNWVMVFAEWFLRNERRMWNKAWTWDWGARLWNDDWLISRDTSFLFFFF